MGRVNLFLLRNGVTVETVRFDVLDPTHDIGSVVIPHRESSGTVPVSYEVSGSVQLGATLYLANTGGADIGVTSLEAISR